MGYAVDLGSSGVQSCADDFKSVVLFLRDLIRVLMTAAYSDGRLSCVSTGNIPS